MHRGNNPRDISLGATDIYLEQLEQLYEDDAAIITRGIADAFKRNK